MMGCGDLTICLVAVLMTCPYLIGRLNASGCEGVNYKTLQSMEAPCAKNQTCDIAGSRGLTPRCEVLYGTECRLIGQGQLNSIRDVTDGGQSPSAFISKLGITPLVLQSNVGPIPVYNFYVEMQIPVQDFKDRLTTGVKMEFQSDDDNNCQYKVSPPVCRYFSLGDNEGDAAGKKAEPKPRYDHHGNSDSQESPEIIFDKDWEYVSLSHSCFGVDVWPGSFLIGLTSYPGSQKTLEYSVKYDYNYEDNYDEYGNYNYDPKSGAWPYRVMGVANYPGTNTIHVVVQGPNTTPDGDNDGNDEIRLELRRFRDIGGQQAETIQAMTITGFSTVFLEVPMGRYHVVVTVPCEFDESCPSFESRDIYVDTPMEQHQNAVPMTTVIIASTVLVCVLCVICTVLVRAWRNGSTKVKSHACSVLVINLEKGRFKERTVTFFSEAMNQLLNLQGIGRGEGGGDISTNSDEKHENYIVKCENIEFLTDSSQQSSLSPRGLDFRTIRLKLRPYRVIIFIKFLPEVDGRTRSSRTAHTADDCDDVIGDIIASFKRHDSKVKFFVVYFTESSPETSYLSLGNSTSSETTVDSGSTVTCLIPIGASGELGKVVGGRRKKTASLLNIMKRPILGDIFKIRNSNNNRNSRFSNHNSSNKNNKNIYTNTNNSSSNNNNNNNNNINNDRNNLGSIAQLYEFPQTFYLPSEVVRFFESIQSCTSTTPTTKTRLNQPAAIPLQAINTCDQWQAALTCCQKSFIDRYQPGRDKDTTAFLCSHGNRNDEECLTIITEDVGSSDNSSQVDVADKWDNSVMTFCCHDARCNARKTQSANDSTPSFSARSSLILTHSEDERSVCRTIISADSYSDIVSSRAQSEEEIFVSVNVNR